MNPKHDVKLEATWGSSGHFYLRRGGFHRRRWHVGFICEAFFGMEPCVDFFWWIFIGRALSEGKLPRIVLGGSVPAQELPQLYEKVQCSMLFC